MPDFINVHHFAPAGRILSVGLLVGVCGFVRLKSLGWGKGRLMLTCLPTTVATNFFEPSKKTAVFGSSISPAHRVGTVIAYLVRE